MILVSEVKGHTLFRLNEFCFNYETYLNIRLRIVIFYGEHLHSSGMTQKLINNPQSVHICFRNIYHPSYWLADLAKVYSGLLNMKIIFTIITLLLLCLSYIVTHKVGTSVWEKMLKN